MKRPEPFIASRWTENEAEVLERALECAFEEIKDSRATINEDSIYSHFEYHALIADDLIQEYERFRSESVASHMELADLDSLEEVLDCFWGHASKYGVLRWRNKIQDSDIHTSFLAVAIFGEPNVVEGVLRLTQKQGGDHFTENDQVLLEAIAKQGIGPKLLTLRHTEFSKKFYFKQLQEVNAISVKESTTALDVADAFKNAMRSFFPEERGSQKLYLVNLLDEDGVRFCHHALGGKLEKDVKAYEGKAYRLENTLTGRALHEPDGVVFVNDPPGAAEQKAMIVIHDKVVCALACRIAFEDRAYGVMVVKSDQQDLRQDVHGRLLEVLAAEAGVILARREVTSLRMVQNLIEMNDMLPTSGSTRQSVQDFVSRILASYDRGTPSDEDLTLDTFNVREALEETTLEVSDKAHRRIRCVAQDVDIQASKSVLSSIVHNLILHRIENSKSSVALHCEIGRCLREPRVDSGPWLKVFIRGSGDDQASDARTQERALSSPFIDCLTLPDKTTPSRLFLARTLAYWHQLAPRRGLLGSDERQQHNRNRLTLYLPVRERGRA